MTSSKPHLTNGLPDWIKPWIALLSTQGLAVLFVLLLIWKGFFDWGPRFMNGFEQNVQTMRTTIEAQKALVDEVHNLNDGVSKIIEVEVETQEFMDEVRGSHFEQNSKLDVIIDQTRK